MTQPKVTNQIWEDLNSAKELRPAQTQVSAQFRAETWATQAQDSAQDKIGQIKEHFPHRNPKKGRRQLNYETKNYKHLQSDEDMADLSFNPKWNSTPEKQRKETNKAKRIVTFNFNQSS